jgi:hypothetical protein
VNTRGVIASPGAVRHRLVVSVLGLAATVLFVGGCSSSVAGSGTGGGAFPGASSAPVGAPSSGGAPNGTGSSDFCTEWLSGTSIAGLSRGQVGTNFITHWDKLAAIAPPEIKSDVQAIDDYLHSAMGGQPDPSKAATLATSVSDVVQYVAKNCH